MQSVSSQRVTSNPEASTPGTRSCSEPKASVQWRQLTLESADLHVPIILYLHNYQKFHYLEFAKPCHLYRQCINFISVNIFHQLTNGSSGKDGNN